MRKNSALVLGMILACWIAGCGSSPVADDVGQREANEIVSKLSEHGIDSSLVKGRGGKGRYSVVVSAARFGAAAGLLNKLGLPAEKKATFQEMTASSGIIPSSREVEALRLDRAAAAELEELLRASSEVVSASVIVRVRSLTAQGLPSATIVVQKLPNSALSSENIKQIAVRAIPGIQSDGVFVSIAEYRGAGLAGVDEQKNNMIPFLFFWAVPSSEYTGLVLLIAGLLVVSGVLAGLAGYILGQFNGINRQSLNTAARTQRSQSTVSGLIDGSDD